MPQGTIKDFNESTKSGVILDDAKQEFAFGHDAFRYTGMRLFRLGQRVKFHLDGERVTDLTILTMSLD